MCKLINGWYYNFLGFDVYWFIVVMENFVNNIGSGFFGWVVDVDKRRIVLEKKYKIRLCMIKIYLGYK